MKTLKKYLKLWPILLWLGVVVFGTVVHIDLVLVPILKKAGFHVIWVLLIAYCVSITLLSYIYWFWGWVRRKIVEVPIIKEEIMFGKEVGQELKEEGYIDKIQNHFIRKFHWLMDGDHWVLKFIKSGGLLAILIISSIPFLPGSRSMIAGLCGVSNWKHGFYTICVGNLIKVSIVVGLWSILIWG